MGLLTGQQTIQVQLLHAAIALLMIGCATVLGALHDLDASTIAALFGTAVGLAGGSAGVSAAMGSAINGKNVITSSALETHSHALAQAIAALGVAAETKAPEQPAQAAQPAPAQAAAAAPPAQAQPPAAPPLAAL